MGNGGCCGNSPAVKNKDVENTVNFSDLIIVLRKKYNNLSLEKQEIEEYLSNPKIKLQYIEIEDVDFATLRKRLLYLPVLEKYYQQTINLIKNTKGLDFEETKEYVHNILYYHLLNYDESEQIAKAVEDLKKYCEKVGKK